MSEVEVEELKKDALDSWSDYVGQFKYAFVDFSAEWCKPCEILDKRLEEIVEKYKDRVTFLRISDDREDPHNEMPDMNVLLMDALNIDAVPTVVIYKNGKLVKIKEKGKEMRYIVGVRKKEYYEQVIQKLLEKDGDVIEIEKS